MSTISSSSLLEQLHWRYAVKQFDTTRKISAADWATLEEALVLSPSSGGVQPWKFIVVTDPAVRQKLSPASYGQDQGRGVPPIPGGLHRQERISPRADKVDAHIARNTAKVTLAFPSGIARPVPRHARWAGSSSRRKGSAAARDAFLGRTPDLHRARQCCSPAPRCFGHRRLLAPWKALIPSQFDKILGLAEERSHRHGHLYPRLPRQNRYPCDAGQGPLPQGEAFPPRLSHSTQPFSLFT